MLVCKLLERHIFKGKSRGIAWNKTLLSLFLTLNPSHASNGHRSATVLQYQRNFFSSDYRAATFHLSYISNGSVCDLSRNRTKRQNSERTA